MILAGAHPHRLIAVLGARLVRPDHSRTSLGPSIIRTRGEHSRGESAMNGLRPSLGPAQRDRKEGLMTGSDAVIVLVLLYLLSR